MDKNRNRSRKSKLQLRECSDDEDDNIMALQTDIEKLVNLKKILVNSNEAVGETSADPFSFQVQVKVEQCTEDDDDPVLLDYAPADGDETDHDHCSTCVGKLYGQRFYLRTLHAPTKDSNIRKVAEYVFTKKNLRRALEVQAKLNNKPADRYIQIELNNVHSDLERLPRSHHEELIQRCLLKWTDWYESSAEHRDAPLLYKCYICDRGWWRLHPFREHIREHNEPQLEVRVEALQHQLHVIASVNRNDEVKVVTVEGDCRWCDRPMDYHADKNGNYECEGCKVMFTSCSRMRAHHALCIKYIELKFKKQLQSSASLMLCKLCGCHCVTSKLLSQHLVDHHSPRSDEPVPMQSTECKHCKMNFFIRSYHDCPRKPKCYKCPYCSRRFTTNAYLDMHKKVSSRVNVACEVCGRSMRQCMLLEHMLSHTRNYKAVYWCGTCDYNIIFLKYNTLQTHMRLHSKSMGKRRFTCKMLLPAKCISGEMAASVRHIDLPQNKVNALLLGKNYTKSKYTVCLPKRIMNSPTTPDAVAVDGDGSGVTPGGKQATLTSDAVDLALQLDEEIQKDLEMEEAISKVFRASNCYKKLMEKETTEPIDDCIYEDDLIILDKPDDVLIVIDSDTDDENGAGAAAGTEDAGEAGEDENLDVDVLNDSTRAIEAPSPDHADQPETSNLDTPVVKEEFNIDIDFEEHDNEYTWDSVRPHGDGEGDDANCDFNVDIKNEPENLYGDEDVPDFIAEPDQVVGAVKMEAADLISDVDVKREHAKRGVEGSASAKEVKKAKVEEFISVKKEIQFSCDEDLLMKQRSGCAAGRGSGNVKRGRKTVSTNPTTSRTVVSDSNCFTCTRCPFEGTYRRYTEHVITTCSSTRWGCTPCAKDFEDLFSYIDHLRDEHGSSCPDCREPVDTPTHFHRHIVIHVRNMFLAGGKYLTAAKWEQECRKCGDAVHLEELFHHWETHLAWEADASGDRADSSRMSQDVMKKIIDCLLLKTKRLGGLAKCVVCAKVFDRKNDNKRHLIEHLLGEALRDKPDTNNCLRCHICSEDLSDVCKWKMHMRCHADLPQYKCELCDKAFSDSSNYAKHRKVHNFCSYVCDKCGNKYHSEASIVKHLELHEQPPVSCKVCDRPFYSTSKLRIHMKQRHQLNTFPCIICKKRFSCLKDKWDHMWDEHRQRNVQADCPLCSKSFRKRSDVKNHLKAEHYMSTLSVVYKSV